ncbi:stage III sporulation protein SpoAB [Oxobacter pfennigii]|uniref:Stage III sporulation protein SpoAB n=1 Tax=Oxobacter pfennigii TaxID=36849 RepID=A0A0P8WAD1_9CLOT|nr:stage III sporulation protein SpoIIIAB [Oxobacter pfennigii]KPU44922.1 stage III sporulation protein SpoAB [Oxobacter pfennigii]
MIKTIGLLLVFISASGVGLILGSQYSSRVRQIKHLKIALQMLETEIVYSNTPLPLAFESVLMRCENPIKKLFTSAVEMLNKRTYSTVGEAFEASLEETKEFFSLKKEDMEILKSFGYSLGNSDVEGQIKSFSVIIKQLDSLEIKAEELRQKNERMYKHLGYLSGLAIVIILM